MANMDRPIKNVVVLGATGNVGLPIIKALVAHPAGYRITAVTRRPGQAPFPFGVGVAETDYSPDSLRSIFTGKDAVVSCVPYTLTGKQQSIIDVAIECGVVRFIPSEFGMDTTHPDAGKVIPQLQAKIDTCKYLERRTDQISYSLIYTGSFFDWVFRFPDAMGYDVPGHRATIYDGGDVEFEVTTVMRIGEAVAAVLAPEHRMETKNQHVFINSFTTTQNQVIAELEKVTGQKFAVAEEKLDGFRERAMQRTDVDPVELHMAVVLIGLCFAGPGGLALCSKDPRIGELWNKRLGLPEESFRNAVEEVVDSYKSASVTGAADSHQD